MYAIDVVCADSCREEPTTRKFKERLRTLRGLRRLRNLSTGRPFGSQTSLYGGQECETVSEAFPEGFSACVVRCCTSN